MLEVVLLSVDDSLFFWCNASSSEPIPWIASRWQDEAGNVTYADRKAAIKDVETYAEANGYRDIKLP